MKEKREQPAERLIEVAEIYQDERRKIISSYLIAVGSYCADCQGFHEEGRFLIFVN